jgi:hypothetical protein
LVLDITVPATERYRVYVDDAAVDSVPASLDEPIAFGLMGSSRLRSTNPPIRPSSYCAILHRCRPAQLKRILIAQTFNTREISCEPRAFATRCHPGHGYILIGEEEMMILPVFLDQDEKRLNYTTKAVHNCLSHDDWKDEI